MYSATVIGPAMRMRRASSSPSGLKARRSLGRLRRDAQGAPDEVGAGEQHRERQPLAHGRAGGEEAEEGIGLAEELDDNAGERVAGEERAGDQTAPTADGLILHQRE